MANECWYDAVGPDVPLTQGDIITACPLLIWNLPTNLEVKRLDAPIASDMVGFIRSDVVVMTQACDLENRKVASVVLTPLRSLIDYRVKWEAAMNEKGQNPSEKAWKRIVKDMADGLVWNHALLDKSNIPQNEADIRVVDFTNVHTVPRDYLEALLVTRNVPRLRLKSPYREHLSQAFARFFMRVGLPTAISI